MQQKILKLSLSQVLTGLIDTKQTSEGLIIKLKSSIKEKRSNLICYLRRIVMTDTNTYSASEKKDQINSLRLMRNQLDHLLLQLGENLNVLANYLNESTNQSKWLKTLFSKVLYLICQKSIRNHQMKQEEYQLSEKKKYIISLVI